MPYVMRGPDGQIQAVRPQVDDADMVCRMARHNGRFAGKQTAHGIDGGSACEPRSGEDLVAVAGDDRVDLGQGRQRGRGILASVFGIRLTDPGMGQSNDDVRARAGVLRRFALG